MSYTPSPHRDTDVRESLETPSSTSTIVHSDPGKPTPDPAPAFPPLKQTSTTLSARQAAHTLDTFPKSAANPRNWSRKKKWRTALTVALTGFISTCGSSIGVPGIHAVMDEFGVTDEKVGILVTTGYVLGLG